MALKGPRLELSDSNAAFGSAFPQLSGATSNEISKRERCGAQCLRE